MPASRSLPGRSPTRKGQYFLAAHADEVFLHPSGALLIRGIGGARGYYKDLLDKLGVKVNTFQAGRYKSFGEPFTRTGPTPEAQEAEAYLLNGLWSTWLADVERLRKLKAGSVMAAINDLPQRLQATDGDIAQLVLQEKLVDGLKRRDEFRALMLERGAPRSRDDDETFRQISMYSYLRYVDTPATGDAVGVVVAQGEIVDGDDRKGTIGARAASELIQRARQDDDIKALVVRIDSPGGSASASELIREQLELTRKAGKPVVVSMGDVAASGGYWIAMGGDEVIADAATITGSIGVFALIPNFTGTMEKIGVNTAGAATTWIAEATDLTRPLDKRLAQVIEAGIGHTYSEFLDVVATNRKSTPGEDQRGRAGPRLVRRAGQGARTGRLGRWARPGGQVGGASRRRWGTVSASNTSSTSRAGWTATWRCSSASSARRCATTSVGTRWRVR